MLVPYKGKEKQYLLYTERLGVRPGKVSRTKATEQKTISENKQVNIVAAAVKKLTQSLP